MYHIWSATAVEGNGHHQRERSWYILSLGRISHVHEFLGWYRKIDGWFWIGRSVWRDLRILWNIYFLEKLTQSALISHLLNSIVNGELDLSELEKTYQTMETGMTEDDSMELSTKQIMKDLAERMAVTRNENIKSHTANSGYCMCSTSASRKNIFSQRERVIDHCISIRSKKWWSLCCFWTYQQC